MTLIGQAESFEHEPVKQSADVSLVTETRTKSDAGTFFRRRELHVEDVSDRNPRLKRRYEVEGNLGEALLRRNGDWKAPTLRCGELEIDENNRAASWLYLETVDGARRPTQMLDWAKDFPTAIALEPLQRLEDGGRMLPQGELDARTLELFTYMIDAIGIRARAKIYAEDLTQLARRKGQDLSILSVGSGAAVPNIEATKRIEGELGYAAHWNLFDIDPRALGFAETLMNEAGFQNSTVDFGPVNEDGGTGYKFRGRSFSRAYREADHSYDVVDALGLWEYLKDDTATTFAKSLYEKVAPGGMMIVSNMLKSRPQLEFNRRAVGWPSLQLRSEDDLLRILADAGIDLGNVTMSYSGDGVYVVVEVDMP